MDSGTFLSIIIPSYLEHELQIYALLASICSQSGVNLDELEILIIKDGGGHVYSQEFCKLFPLHITQYAMPENVGPGMVREAGINLAHGEYIMFCDADDSLQNVTALQTLISAAQQEKPDILRSEWFEEVVSSDGTVKYMHKANENTWLHGKLFRRQFLIEKNIQFHPDLRVHEDTYFLSIAAASTDKYLTVPAPTYLWKHNPQSITRGNDHEYQYKSFPEFFRASGLAHDIVAEINPASMEYKVIQITCYCYFSLHTSKWMKPEVKRWRDAVENNFATYHKPTWHYFLDAKPESVRKIYNEERQKHFSGEMESETMPDWLQRIGMDLPEWMGSSSQEVSHA